MKSLIVFQQRLLMEMGKWCHTSTSLDQKTIETRVKHEGYSFYTITLPTFAKDLQKALDQGFVDRSLFTSFSRKAELPRFLGGFLDLVFDRCTGRLLDAPSIDAIYAIRQISLLFSKIEIPCSDERVTRAIGDYIECESTVRTFDGRRADHPEMDDQFFRIAMLLVRNMASDVDLSVYTGSVLPRISSGANVEKIRGNPRYLFRDWTERLERIFPSGEYAQPSWALQGEEPPLSVLLPGAEKPVRVITVPKTSKAPRIIAIEPLAMQYMQQAILEAMTEATERDDILSWLVSSKSQLPNQELAREGSITGNLATLDLSEASDRVSNQLVRIMLRRFPHFAEGVDASRSRKADVRGHGVIRLAKFASMGSALCFPFEALVFATLIFCGIEDALNRRLTRESILAFKGTVRVYGDDIIIPVDYVSIVVSKLEDFGLKVNASKSYWTGRFRESCGKDYYAGFDVSVVKVRRVFPNTTMHADEIESIVSLRNQLYKRGFRDTIDYLDKWIMGLIPFPYVEDTSPCLGRISDEGHQTDFWDEKLQIPLVRGAVAVPKIPLSHLEGSGALLKFFLKRGETPLEEKHLERAGRPNRVDIKVRRLPAY